MAKGYYLPDEENILSRQWLKIVKKYEPLPEFPKIVQIQTKSGCNANCAFCPNYKTINKLSHGTMDMELFKKIIDECVRYPMKRISPYLMNEPLADKDICEKIAYITKVKKEPTYTKINTNATFLDEEMARKILDSGLDRISISFHGITKETYEKSMKGLNFEKNLRNVERFVELKNKGNYKKPRIRITMVHTNLNDKELDKIREFWRNRGLKINVHALENRTSNAVERNSLNIKKWKRLSKCVRLMEQAYILYNGDVLLCCVDWERSTVLGNLKKHSLYEVWNSEKYMKIRRAYYRNKTEGILCGKCLIQDEEDFVMS
ncbi:MAG: radical SAM protein [Candidatus Schekmanbacteria bacterium]|nr:MAG: radical SAM protein [Candidatus Schekmanbacteria bacterium]